jgi:D-3-phosphoglycerate dehydrogenase
MASRTEVARRTAKKNCQEKPSRKLPGNMTVNNKRVFYVKYLAHEIYIDILKARADVRLDRLENESPDAVAAPILSAAHAYQVGAARDEIAKHFHVARDLL